MHRLLHLNLKIYLRPHHCFISQCGLLEESHPCVMDTDQGSNDGKLSREMCKTNFKAFLLKFLTRAEVSCDPDGVFKLLNVCPEGPLIITETDSFACCFEHLAHFPADHRGERSKPVSVDGVRRRFYLCNRVCPTEAQQKL